MITQSGSWRRVFEEFLRGVVFVTFVSSSIAFSAPPSPITTEKLWDIFAERRKASETVQASWRTTMRFSEAYPAGRTVRPRGKDNQPNPQPPGKVELPETGSTISISGDRVRYDNRGASFVGDDKGVDVPMSRAFDGSILTTLVNYSGVTDRKPQGRVAGADEFDSWGTIHLLPLFYAVRPFHKDVFGTREEWSLLPETARINNQECVVLKSLRGREDPAAQIAVTVWIEANRLFPLRVTYENNGHVVAKCDMEFTRNEAANWIPSSWSSEIYTGAGEVLEASKNHLQSVSLNTPIDESLFLIEFPVGTVVIDKLLDDATFIVAEDGGLLPYTESQRAVTITGQSSTGQSRMWLIVVSGIFVLLLLGWVLRKKFRVHRLP